jgi:cold shock CspA family protein
MTAVQICLLTSRNPGFGFKTLKDGQRVTFEVKQGPKGLQASAIKPA